MCSVIDLHEIFMLHDVAMDADCFQQAVRYVSGMRKLFVFWINLGSQRVMMTLTQGLGITILKISLVQ